jgi:hypothetical protein
VATWLGVGTSAMVRESNACVMVVNAPGTYPPEHLLSDEKFAQLAGEEIYLFLISQGKFVWYGEWLDSTKEEAFNESIREFLAVMEASAQEQQLLQPGQPYQPVSVTTDGWASAQNAWEAQVPDITLIECNLHGRKRVDVTIEAYAKEYPNLSQNQRQRIKEQFDSIFAAPSLAAFSQRLRRTAELYHDQPILLKRLNILKDKRFLFTNHLKFNNAPAFSASLDRSMRFLDEKLVSFG